MHSNVVVLNLHNIDVTFASSASTDPVFFPFWSELHSMNQGLSDYAMPFQSLFSFGALALPDNMVPSVINNWGNRHALIYDACSWMIARRTY